MVKEGARYVGGGLGERVGVGVGVMDLINISRSGALEGLSADIGVGARWGFEGVCTRVITSALRQKVLLEHY